MGTDRLVQDRGRPDGGRMIVQLAGHAAAVHSTFELRDEALVLLANPLPDHPGRHAGPTFEWGTP